MALVLPASVRDEIVAHALQGDPVEVVGVLAGTRADDESTAWTLYRAGNAAEEPRTRYEIAPAEELSLLDRIDGTGHDVVGFYHSHPRGPLEPSATDERLAAWPGYSYVIVSLAGDVELGSWRWTGDRFEREELQVR